MVLLNLAFVLPSFPSYRVGDNFVVVPHHGFMEDLVTAVIAEVFLMLFFA